MLSSVVPGGKMVGSLTHSVFFCILHSPLNVVRHEWVCFVFTLDTDH
jgi:hypothetical protein